MVINTRTEMNSIIKKMMKANNVIKIGRIETMTVMTSELIMTIFKMETNEHNYYAEDYKYTLITKTNVMVFMTIRRITGSFIQPHF